MNKREAYIRRMSKQTPDKEAIRENNVELWMEQYPFELDQIDLDFIDEIYNKILNTDERVFGIGSENRLNGLGYKLLKESEIINYDDMFYFDYSWFANNLYTFKDPEVVKIKNALYSNKYKIFLIRNAPNSKIGSAISPKVLSTVRDMIIEQALKNPKLKIVFSDTFGDVGSSMDEEKGVVSLVRRRIDEF